jgi:hypothetical protein
MGRQRRRPAGTIIDDSDPAWAKVMESNGSFPPPNGMPLDQATFDLMRTRYEAYRIFTTGDAINRH